MAVSVPEAFTGTVAKLQPWQQARVSTARVDRTRECDREHKCRACVRAGARGSLHVCTACVCGAAVSSAALDKTELCKSG